MSDVNFLSDLTASLTTTSRSNPPRTADFVQTMARIIPVFDHLGSVLSFAKTDMVAKIPLFASVLQPLHKPPHRCQASKVPFVQNETLEKAAAEYETLADVVAADKQAGTVTTKGSLARNAHRLRTVIVFMEKIMLNLHADQSTSLATAVSGAYADTLAAYHGMVVRATCNAGFLLLPARAAFLKSLGETEETASKKLGPFLEAAKAVIASVDSLYDVAMPASTSWM